MRSSDLYVFEGTDYVHSTVQHEASLEEDTACRLRAIQNSIDFDLR